MPTIRLALQLGTAEHLGLVQTKVTIDVKSPLEGEFIQRMSGGCGPPWAPEPETLRRTTARDMIMGARNYGAAGDRGLRGRQHLELRPRGHRAGTGPVRQPGG